MKKIENKKGQENKSSEKNRIGIKYEIIERSKR